MEKQISKMTIKEAKEELEKTKEKYQELCNIFNMTANLEVTPTKNKKEQDHGCCICILSNGFMYIGDLTTDGELLTIKKPINIRQYTSGKGLLWHAKNGSEDMTLDRYDGILKAPYSELKHFIPTESDLWN